jgi:hypothetical protein
MELGGSLQCSKLPAIGPYFESVQSSLHLHSLYLGFRILYYSPTNAQEPCFHVNILRAFSCHTCCISSGFDHPYNIMFPLTAAYGNCVMYFSEHESLKLVAGNLFITVCVLVLRCDNYSRHTMVYPKVSGLSR